VSFGLAQTFKVCGNPETLGYGGPMKVRAKTHVHVGEQVFEAGQIVELDDETAKASPWAFEIQSEVPSPKSEEK
jgi:hypothetical protein